MAHQKPIITGSRLKRFRIFTHKRECESLFTDYTFRLSPHSLTCLLNPLLCSLASSFSCTADICSLSTVCPTRSASYQFKGGETALAVIHFGSGPQQRSHIAVTPVKLIKLSVSGTWGTRFSKYLRHVKIFSWITIICQNITSVACFLLLALCLQSTLSSFTAVVCVTTVLSNRSTFLYPVPFYYYFWP